MQYMRVRDKNSNTQGSSPNMLKVIFQYLKELLLKERIRYPLRADSFIEEKFPF